METFIDQAFRFIGNGGVENAAKELKLRDGEVLYSSIRAYAYSTGSFIFALWLIQYTIHAYILVCIFSLGRRFPRLGKVNTAAVMLALALVNGGSDLSLTGSRLIVRRGNEQLMIPFDRLHGIDARAGWIANTLTMHYLDQAGMESKIKFWVLDPHQIAGEIQSLTTGSRT